MTLRSLNLIVRLSSDLLNHFLTVTLANTPIDKQNVHNCVGTMLDETRCCRKSAFNLKPNVPKGKFNIITVDLSKTTENDNCVGGKPLNAHW
ncbi:uncharacterized protein PGTG_22444 [Puccinia graminis f. sp. tritici CRL 75-36-700-3]|uniref:Uncharacterized protein n=1 Tax=Puccinia graminis f. sp. tritici (strain CRL 75-36-700-3 / race SCCL) TaxID=418459 RepID=H6QUG5_PUCGT|nr:uncharacterized protein PGTG_22444 [Puccinia graminis f. sp. tritici CRL 75-36-700-3]EHS64628.1 hypothetical protein PGTG_22444 [Puccinia graminis f. sp. tritici CRL 75-36-700-3]